MAMNMLAGSENRLCKKPDQEPPKCVYLSAAWKLSPVLPSAGYKNLVRNKIHKKVHETNAREVFGIRYKNNVIAIPVNNKAFPSLAKRRQNSKSIMLRGCSWLFILQNTYAMRGRKHISGWKSKRLALKATGVIHHVRATSQDWLSVASNFFVYIQSGIAVNAMQSDCIASKQSGLDQIEYNNDIGSKANAPWSAKICISWIVPGAKIPLLAIHRYCSKIPRS